MIQTISDLFSYLSYEEKLYKASNKKDIFLDVATSMPRRCIWKYVRLLRITEYFYNNRGNPIYGLMYLLFRRRKNRLGLKIGIEIFENSCEKGLHIYHAGNIVINGCARIGYNCQLHGGNCIGNTGKDKQVPVIGDNVDIGAGASIIGGIHIADNIKIGAGAVVVHSCDIDGATLVGIPANALERNNL